MRHIVLILGLLLAACTGEARMPVATGHPLEGTVWDVTAGRPIDRETLAARVAEADIAVLGEIHDNPRHHERQAWLVGQMRPAGLAFEMIPEASEEGIQVFLDQGAAPGEIGPAIGWERLGWPSWSMYRAIVEAAPGAYIAGGGVATEALMGAMAAGAVAAFGPGAGAYGLDRGLAETDRAALTAEMVAAHCGALPDAVAARMVEAQRLRDARFAHAARRASAAGGGSAALITGNGHARTDRGVPAALSEAAPAAKVVSLGQLEVVPGRVRLGDYGEAGPPPYDYVWFSAPAERGDPCAAFK